MGLFGVYFEILYPIFFHAYRQHTIPLCQEFQISFLFKAE